MKTLLFSTAFLLLFFSVFGQEIENPARAWTNKDGKTISGKVWIFHENGQNKKEYTYKGDKLISTKEWNEDGDPK